MTAWLLMLALAAPLRSGLEDMSPALQALQRDDSQNPGMLWVRQGEHLFGAQCQRCHAQPPSAKRFPALSEGKLMNLGQRINACRAPAPAWGSEAPELLALTAFLGHRERGQLVEAPKDAALQADLREGERLFRQPMGQLGLSCAQCHDGQAGRRLGGSVILQGHANGYPVYRLAWQDMGSLQRRLRGCMTGVRAEPFAADDPAWTLLELYLKQRGAGLPIEVPAVRP